MRSRSRSRSTERDRLRQSPATRTAPTAAKARHRIRPAPLWTGRLPQGRVNSASIRPRFLPTTTPRASSSAWAIYCVRVPRSRTSMTSAPSSLTVRWNRREIAERMMRVGGNKVERIVSGTLRGSVALVLCALLLLTFVKPAAADFNLCNNTGSRVGIAIGYKDAEGWSTEGWWNLAPRKCETLVKGQLVARYYYVYAVDYDRGGEWSGKAFMCTRDKEFTIKGIEDCLARGFDRTGFFEVDTSEQRSWTVQLTEQADQPAQFPPSVAPSAIPGLPKQTK